MSRGIGPAAKLGPRQERFVQEYLLDLNAKQAAIRAGYSPRTAEVQGSRLLSNAKVQGALSDAINRRAAKVEIDQEWVLSRLALIVERALQHAPVLDRTGNSVVIKTPQGQLAAAFAFQPAAATRALELLGKHVGLFTDRLEVKEETEELLLPGFTRDDILTRLIDTAGPQVLARVLADRGMKVIHHGQEHNGSGHASGHGAQRYLGENGTLAQVRTGRGGSART